LAGLVRESGIKVVLTGEGADEIFAGYNIFKEDKVRRFWARQPTSKLRPLLLTRLYPYINKNASGQAFWRMFFKKGLEDTHHPYYSHLIRWNNTAQIKGLFSPDFRSRMNDEAMYAELSDYLDPDYSRWDPLSRSQYLEMMLFMSGYLLSSQGDRMMMGQSIEGRFPFLDHRVIEFAAGIAPKWKLNGLNEKFVLKRAFSDLIPASIINRPKQPYRAPISPCFLGEKKSLASSLIEDDALKQAGYFDPGAAKQLFQKIKKADGVNVSAREDMGLVGIVSLQLLHHHFLGSAAQPSSSVSPKTETGKVIEASGGASTSTGEK
jgi:asparagine synthase (glutamine-hydrolysing)